MPASEGERHVSVTFPCWSWSCSVVPFLFIFRALSAKNSINSPAERQRWIRAGLMFISYGGASLRKIIKYHSIQTLQPHADGSRGLRRDCAHGGPRSQASSASPQFRAGPTQSQLSPRSGVPWPALHEASVPEFQPYELSPATF